MRYVTHDTWHELYGERWIFSQNFWSLAHIVWKLRRFEDFEENDHWLNELIKRPCKLGHPFESHSIEFFAPWFKQLLALFLVCCNTIFSVKKEGVWKSTIQQGKCFDHLTSHLMMAVRKLTMLTELSRDKLCSSFSVLLLAVPEAVSSHTKMRRITSTRS